METNGWEGVEEALEEGLRLESGRSFIGGVPVNLYEVTEEPEAKARGDSSRGIPPSEVDAKSDYESIGPPSLPVAIGRAGADYQNTEKPADHVEAVDELTEIYFNQNIMGMSGWYDDGDYVLEIRDYRGTGENLREAYDNLKSTLIEALEEAEEDQS